MFYRVIKHMLRRGGGRGIYEATLKEKLKVTA
jgi:hypothetical protein